MNAPTSENPRSFLKSGGNFRIFDDGGDLRPTPSAGRAAIIFLRWRDHNDLTG